MATDPDKDIGEEHIDRPTDVANRAKADTASSRPPPSQQRNTGGSSMSDHMFAHGRPRTDG